MSGKQVPQQAEVRSSHWGSDWEAELVRSGQFTCDPHTADSAVWSDVPFVFRCPKCSVRSVRSLLVVRSGAPSSILVPSP